MSSKHILVKNDNYKSLNEELNAIFNEINSAFNKYFYVSEDYTFENTSLYTTKSLKPYSKEETILCELVKKVTYLYYQITTHTEEFESTLRKDYFLSSKNGWDCALYSLILKNITKKILNIDLDYIQGIYRFKNNGIASMLFGEYSYGSHAWCAYKGAILDTTLVCQQYNSYHGEFDSIYIFGEMPKDIILAGYIESKEIEEKYLNDILKLHNCTLDEWIDNYITFLDVKDIKNTH